MDNGHEPATKADIADLRAEVAAGLNQVRAEVAAGLNQVRAEFHQDIEQVRSEFHHSFDDLKEAMRDGQTELLKAFYNFAQTSDERMASTEAEAASLKKRLAILEGRVKDVEMRLNKPPAA